MRMRKEFLRAVSVQMPNDMETFLKSNNLPLDIEDENGLLADGNIASILT